MNIEITLETGLKLMFTMFLVSGLFEIVIHSYFGALADLMLANIFLQLWLWKVDHG